MQEDDKLLTLREAQEYLRASRSTVLRLVERGEIQAHRVGKGLRFYVRDLRMAVKPRSTAIGVYSVRNEEELVDIEGD
jgi:excisionase family DNA binding protein